jgi:hypothetical protein
MNSERTKREIHKFRLFTNSRGYAIESEHAGYIIMKNERVPGCKMVFDPSENAQRYTLQFASKILAKGSTLEKFRENVGYK